MQKLNPFVLYVGIVSSAVAGILRLGQAQIMSVGPKSFAALAALCFLFVMAGSLSARKTEGKAP